MGMKPTDILEWMRTPNPVLCDRTPIEIIQTEVDAGPLCDVALGYRSKEEFINLYGDDFFNKYE